MEEFWIEVMVLELGGWDGLYRYLEGSFSRIW